MPVATKPPPCKVYSSALLGPSSEFLSLNLSNFFPCPLSTQDGSCFLQLLPPWFLHFPLSVSWLTTFHLLNNSYVKFSIWVAGAVFVSRLEPDWGISAVDLLPPPFPKCCFLLSVLASMIPWIIEIKYSWSRIWWQEVRVNVAWGKTEDVCSWLLVVLGMQHGEKPFAKSVAHTSWQRLCWPAPVKRLHLGQQLQLESSPDCIYNNPQSFSKTHLPSAQTEQTSWTGMRSLPLLLSSHYGSANFCNSPKDIQSLLDSYPEKMGSSRGFHVGLATVMALTPQGSSASCHEFLFRLYNQDLRRLWVHRCSRPILNWTWAQTPSITWPNKPHCGLPVKTGKIRTICHL